MGWILCVHTLLITEDIFLFNVIKHQFSLDWMSMGNTSIFMYVFVCKYIMNKSILVEGAPTKGMESLYVAHFLCVHQNLEIKIDIHNFFPSHLPFMCCLNA